MTKKTGPPVKNASSKGLSPMIAHLNTSTNGNITGISSDSSLDGGANGAA